MAKHAWLAGLMTLLLLARGPSSVHLVQTAPIHGADVLGDKNRAGPDGWVQAPIPCTDAASGTSPGEGNASRSADSTPRPVPDSGKSLPAGQDPGTPLGAPQASKK